MCVSKASNAVKLIDFGLAQYYDGHSDVSGLISSGFSSRNRVPIPIGHSYF
jgi:hypothetical protein